MPAVLARFDWQALATPLAGVPEPTDAHWIAESKGALIALMVDGHGQGQRALAASSMAMAMLRESVTRDPLAKLLPRAHAKLAGTPGVSAVAARISADPGRLDFSGVGRIHARLVTRSGVTSLGSAGGVLGVGRQAAPEPIALPWSKDSLLVIASDGLVDRWDLSGIASLATAPADEVIRFFCRPFGRQPDDVTILAIRQS